MAESPSTVRINPHQTVTKKVISGPEGSFELTQVTTDFQSLSAENKAYFQPKVDVGSGYLDLVPETEPDIERGIEGIKKPSEIALSPEQREEIIKNGRIPEVMPFMAGLRIAWAERRAKWHQGDAELALRSAHVARHAALNAIQGEPTAPEDEFRPRTLREKAALTRMGRLIQRANTNNSSANILEEMHTYPDEKKKAAKEDREPQPDFDRHKGNLSVFEKRHRESEVKRYDRRRKRSDRLIHGQRIPFTDKRIGLINFARLARGGKDPVEKAEKSLQKRDDALLKAEALRRAKSARS